MKLYFLLMFSVGDFIYMYILINLWNYNLSRLSKKKPEKPSRVFDSVHMLTRVTIPS